MRFRLTVQRNGFPPTQILWSSQGVGPDQGAGSENTTVAHFLEQVNQIVPLESEDWGLEDYAVEVQGFECLHFSVLNHVLKENDQVTIRPLQITDRRIRRVSGRHQISSDGRHLVDGVAFGRPFLRRSNRPAIRIPSLKRPRLEYRYEDDDDDEIPEPNQLMLRDSAQDDVDNEEEYNGIEDVDIGGQLNGSMGDGQGRRRSSRKRRRTGLGIDDASLSALFEGEAPLTNGYVHEDGTATRANGLRDSRRSSRSSTKSVRFDGHDVETPATILAVEDSSDSEDDDFDPAGDVDSSNSSDKENMEPQVNGDHDENPSDEETSSSGTSSSELEDSVASSGFSTSSDSSDSSDSESTSESEDESEETSTDLPDKSSLLDPGQSPESKKHPQETLATKKPGPLVQPPEDLPSQDVETTQTTTPPNQGSMRTKTRNARRRRQTARNRMMEDGVLPETATFIEDATEERSRSAGRLEPEADDESAMIMEAKRKELLQSLASAPAEMDQPAEVVSANEALSMPKEAPPVTETQDRAMQGDKTAEESVQPVPKYAGGPSKDNQEALDTEMENGVTPAPSQRRLKLDVEASRRFILNSLRLRGSGPRSSGGSRRKSEAASVPDSSVQVPEKPQGEEPVGADTHDQDWRSKIDLWAVECCHDGVKLSTPPFPFYQRWDPQQQLESGGRGKRGKKRKRNRTQYYDFGEDGGYENEASYAQYEPDFEVEEDGLAPGLNDEAMEQAAVDGQLLQDAHASAINRSQPEDLPELPADLSTYKDLKEADMVRGAIIAFKHIDCSPATKWCPNLSGYKTATVDSVLSDGTMELTLAYRDAVIPERQFDPETGRRIYDKFEMPDYDDGEENDDGRFLSIKFDDLFQPKLIAPGKEEESAVRNGEQDDSRSTQSMGQEPEAVVDSVHSIQSVGEHVREETHLEQDVSEQPSPRDLHHNPPAHPSKVGTLLRVEVPLTTGVADIAAEDRQDISLLIKEAGFRTEVHSEVAGGLGQLSNVPVEDAQDASPAHNGQDHTMDADDEAQASPDPVQNGDVDDSDISEFQSPFIEGTSPVARRSSEPNDGTLPFQPSFEPEDLTFVSTVTSPDSETRNDLDFSIPSIRSRTKPSPVNAIPASDPKDQPLSKRTRSSLAPATDQGAALKTEPRLSRKSNPAKATPKAQTSSEADFPSPAVPFGQSLTQPNPLPARFDHADAVPEPALPASSPIRRSNKRKRAAKAASPTSSDAVPTISMADVFADSDSDDSPDRASTPNPRSAKKKLTEAIPGKSEPRRSKPKNSRSAPVVDLTLSSGPASPEKGDAEDQQTVHVRREKELPMGSGWVRKSFGAAKRKATPVKRTRSSV